MGSSATVKILPLSVQDVHTVSALPRLISYDHSVQHFMEVVLMRSFNYMDTQEPKFEKYRFILLWLCKGMSITYKFKTWSI